MLVIGCSVAPPDGVDPLRSGQPSPSRPTMRLPPPTPSPSPSPSGGSVSASCPPFRTEPPAMPELPPEVDETTRTAIRMRIDYGLRHDLFWVEHVAAQPNITMAWGFPMLPSEETILFSRNPGTEIVQAAIARYGHGDEFGGLWIDQAIGGVIVLAWKGDVARHEAGMRAELPACHPLVFRKVRFSLAELEPWRDRVQADMDWLADIPAAFQGLGVDEKANAVVLQISSARPDAERLILAHYGAPDGVIRVESDGTGAVLLPWGTVVGRVHTFEGEAPVGELMVAYGANGVPGSCATEPFGVWVDADGRFEMPCQVGRRSVEIRVRTLESDWELLTSVEVDVVEGGRVPVELRLPEDYRPAPP
jgi:hypothetical protein